jgi:signal transduction histidine kinase
VVDDEAPNRLLLRELLEPHGYAVVEATNGEDGLALAQTARPDVILLDVMMPKFDGFEVCRRLKSAPQTGAMPVLIVTSLSARQERLQGIAAGANDFVTKPIDRADLLLRVRNALAAKRLYDQMEDQYIRLRELESLRDSLVHMLVHDVRSPLSALMAYVHLLHMEAAQAQTVEIAGIAVELETLARRMSAMVDTVLDVNRMEAGRMPLEMHDVDIRTLLQEAVRALGPSALTRVRLEMPGQPVGATLDQAVIGRVAINLVGNALKFSADAVPVRVTVSANDAAIEVAVRDAGPGIPQDEMSTIFEKFGRARAHQRNHGTGLGLTFCKMAVEAHGGAIGAFSAVGEGSTFWFRIPRSPVPGRTAQ